MKSLRIHYLQHVSFEDPGCIKYWTLEKKHQLTATKLYKNETFPDLDAIDWLIIMGGPMSVNDSDIIDWINAEKEFIAKAINAGKTIIGICLGSQLIASVLGAEIYRNEHKEIGWFPIHIADNSSNLLFDNIGSYPVFHWHGETFDLPENATLLASSEACKNQAFLYGRNILGLQFHFEVTEDSLQQMITFGKEDIEGTTYTQEPEFISGQKELIKENNRRMYNILNHFESL